MPPRPTSKLRLTVEGSDDKHSVIHLLKRHGVDWDADSPAVPYVEPAGSVDNVLASLEPGARTFARFGIVVDADTAPVQRWEQIRDRLLSLGIAAPKEVRPGGTIVPGLRSGNRIGVWIMPDNREPGILEDFLAKLVPAEDACWAHAGQSTDQARSLGAPLAEKDRSKGILYAWLAWRDHPGLPFGTALTARVLGHDSADALQFAAWFRRLFFEAT